MLACQAKTHENFISSQGLNDFKSYYVQVLRWIVHYSLVNIIIVPLCHNNSKLSSMLNRKRWKKALEREEKKSPLLIWIENQLRKINYDLSDANCFFLIKDIIEQHGDSLIIQLYVKPLKGIYSEIEFSPKVFVSNFDFTHRPHIYNDRRIFHPNIDVYTCQFIYPELIRDWNPTQQFGLIFQHLKYTILEPNLRFVPISDINKKAAWNYHFNKRNYRQLIIENSPLYLDIFIEEHMKKESNIRMQVENASEKSQETAKSKFQFWSIENIIGRRNRNPSSRSNLQNDEEEKSILMLTKQIKQLQMNQEEEKTIISQQLS